MEKYRSQTWLRHRNRVVQQEEEVKDALEEVSSDLEHRVKVGVGVGLTVGLVALAGYSLYKSFSGGEKSKKQKVVVKSKEKQEVVKEAGAESGTNHSSGFSFKRMVLEKLAMVALKFIGAQLAIMLSKKFGVADDESESETN
ncbi:hypothetical protein [Marinoscillum furvescens]|uniref:Uncharacterized protein n=1 Tax=Marinoscillum furvescens DSM 4134 TaxID=1122208 RepID=A0A3D9LKR6_MARFU|nr:hypothetical protein [Marinoscillum furvescens]REE05852.1 hypothetical protein C7460_101371 [Marinoscillum furvescens DSM 4134]